MSRRVVWLHENQNLAGTLRRIAGQLERGEIRANNFTLIGDTPEGVTLYQIGSLDSHAGTDAIFNMAMGTAWLTRQTLEGFDQ